MLIIIIIKGFLPVILVDGPKAEQLVWRQAADVLLAQAVQLLLLVGLQAVQLLLALTAAELTQLPVQPLTLTRDKAAQAGQLLCGSLHHKQIKGLNTQV